MREQTKRKISATLKGRRPSDEAVRKIIRARGLRPTGPEKKLTALLTKHKLPFIYCGDGSVILGGRCPDFINANGKKQLIEIFGTYWHNIFDVAKRTDHFRQYGFDTLVIWADELRNERQVINRMTKFAGTGRQHGGHTSRN